MRVIKRMAGVMLFVIAGVALLVGSIWLDHTRVTTLPTPTGPFPVGRTTYAWSDAQPDPLAPQPGTKRELLAWIWYPAAPPGPSQSVDHYLPGPWRTALESQQSVLLTKFLTRDLSRVRIHSFRDADISPQYR